MANSEWHGYRPRGRISPTMIRRICAAHHSIPPSELYDIILTNLIRLLSRRAMDDKIMRPSLGYRVLYQVNRRSWDLLNDSDLLRDQVTRLRGNKKLQALLRREVPVAKLEVMDITSRIGMWNVSLPVCAEDRTGQIVDFANLVIEAGDGMSAVSTKEFARVVGWVVQMLMHTARNHCLLVQYKESHRAIFESFAGSYFRGEGWLERRGGQKVRMRHMMLTPVMMMKRGWKPGIMWYSEWRGATKERTTGSKLASIFPEFYPPKHPRAVVLAWQ
jgi:hypothetical protein